MMGELPKKKKYNHNHCGVFGIDETNAFRRQSGLSEIVQGLRKCLRCDREFMSGDIFRERICSPCGWRR